MLERNPSWRAERLRRSPLLPRRNEILLGTDGGEHVVVVPDEGSFIVADLRRGIATRREGNATKQFCSACWPSMRWRGGRLGKPGVARLRAMLEAALTH